MKKELVIVGNGMAAGRLVDELLAQPSLDYRITVIGDEPEGSYNRIMLSAVLADEIKESTIIQKDRHFYEQNDIRFLGGCRVESIAVERHSLRLFEGSELGYDQLVLTTGAMPARIAAANQNIAGVSNFRTLGDVHHMKNASLRCGKALVVGGGLLGLEAAYGLSQLGMSVTLVHRSHHLLSRQLDKGAGSYLRAVMEAKNIAFELGAEIVEFHGQDKVHAATTSTGKTLPCELAVIATGIRPNHLLADAAGLATGRGVIVDEHMRTSDPSISALGECCEFRGETFGLVEPIWQQCQVLAARLAQVPYEPFSLRPVATKLKVSGVNVFSAGDYATSGEHRELLLDDPRQHIYRKLLLKDDRLVGIVLFGDTRDGNFYFDLMQTGTNVAPQAHNLLFGSAYCDFDDHPQAVA